MIGQREQVLFRAVLCPGARKSGRPLYGEGAKHQRMLWVGSNRLLAASAPRLTSAFAKGPASRMFTAHHYSLRDENEQWKMKDQCEIDAARAATLPVASSRLAMAFLRFAACARSVIQATCCGTQSEATGSKVCSKISTELVLG